MNIFDSLQLIGGFLTFIGSIFQIHQTIKTKSVKDISWMNYLSLTVGIGMMEVYSVHLVTNGSGLMFLVTNSISLLLSGTILFLIIYYKNKNQTTL